MKHNKMMKHILPVLLAALVALSSLGLGASGTGRGSKQRFC